MTDLVLQCQQLQKTYVDGELNVEVLKSIDFSVERGERVAILGPSGSGKSTLLHLMGGLDTPTAGKVLIDGVDIHRVNETQRCQIRNYKLGFVYQFHHLLPEFSALENVAMPLLVRGVKVVQATKQASELLSKVGLAERLSHKVSQLSGGERQRTAIARALVTNPMCLLADEPTGNLDQQTADKVYETMLELNQDLQTSLLIVTHDLRLARRMDRVYQIQDGQIHAVELSESPSEELREQTA